MNTAASVRVPANGVLVRKRLRFPGKNAAVPGLAVLILVSAPLCAAAPPAIPPGAPGPPRPFSASPSPAAPESVQTPAPVSPAADPLSALSPVEVQEALQWLAANAARADLLSQDALNLAALRGLLTQPVPRNGSAVISSPASAGPWLLPAASPPSPAPPPLLHAPLGSTAVYLRPGIPDAAGVAALSAILRALPEETVTIVLELRVPLPDQPLAPAASLAGLFLPEGVPLFQIRRARGNPEILASSGTVRTGGRLWLLTDDTTPPVLGLTARLLVRHAGAQVLGTPPPDLLTETSDYPLGSAGARLRVVSALALGPDGTPFQGIPLTPQIPVPPRPESRAALLALTDPAAPAAHLVETDRPRLNEAALMAGTTPVTLSAAPDSSQDEKPDSPPASSGSSSSPPATAPRPDPVLQQAHDLLKSAARLNLDAPEEIRKPSASGTGATGK